MSEDVVVEDGYYANQRFVTLNSSASLATSLGAGTLAGARASGIGAADYESLAGFAGTVVERAHSYGSAAAIEDVMVETLPGATHAFETLLSMERSTALVAATPLRRPVLGDSSLADLLSPGSGQVFAACLEAIRIQEDEQTSVIAGTVLLEFDSADSAEEAHRQLAADPEAVTSIERVPARWLETDTPEEVLSPVNPWHLTRIGLDRVREAEGFKDGQDVELAVLDTGIDENHPFFAGRLGPYSYEPPRPGIPSDRRDISSHGTHVAGTIGADGPTGNVEGVCRARLHIYKIFSDQVGRVRRFYGPDNQPYMRNEYFVHPVMYSRALQDCADSNFPVLNLSIGGTAEGSTDESDCSRLSLTRARS